MQQVGLFYIVFLLNRLSLIFIRDLAKKKLICLNQVVENGPATFAAIAVLDRVLEKAKSDKTWLVMLDRVATALLVAHSDSQPVNSLSDRKVVECRDIGLFSISNSISCRTSHIECIR